MLLSLDLKTCFRVGSILFLFSCLFQISKVERILTEEYGQCSENPNARSSCCGQVGYESDCSGLGCCGGIGLNPGPVQHVKGSSVAAAWIQSLARELPHAGGAAIKKKKKIPIAAVRQWVILGKSPASFPGRWGQFSPPSKGGHWRALCAFQERIWCKTIRIIIVTGNFNQSL